MNHAHTNFMSLFLLVLVLLQSTAENEWPMYGQNPGQTRSLSCPLPDDLEIKWTYEFPDDPAYGHEWLIPPVIANKRVYFADRTHIFCLDADTGEVLSTWDHSFYPQVHITIHDPYIYIGGRCLDIQTGDIIWETDLGILHSMPIYYEGTIYIPSLRGVDSISELLAPLVGHNMNAINCLDGNTGEIIWDLTYPVEVGAWDTRIFSHVFTLLGIDDGKLYYGLTTSYELGRSIHCLDAETGKEIWRKEIGETKSGFLKIMGPNITVGGGNLFCIISDSVFCLNGKTGTVKWEYSLPEKAGGKAPMALHGSTLFLREINTVIALNTEDGTFLWKTPVPGMDTKPAFSDGKVVVGSDDHRVYVLDGKSGEIITTYDCGERVYDPVIASGKIFVTSKRTLYVLGEKNYNFAIYLSLVIFTFLVLGYVAKKYG